MSRPLYWSIYLFIYPAGSENIEVQTYTLTSVIIAGLIICREGGGGGAELLRRGREGGGVEERARLQQ